MWEFDASAADVQELKERVAFIRYDMGAVERSVKLYGIQADALFLLSILFLVSVILLPPGYEQNWVRTREQHESLFAALHALSVTCALGGALFSYMRSSAIGKLERMVKYLEFLKGKLEFLEGIENAKRLDI